MRYKLTSNVSNMGREFEAQDETEARMVCVRASQGVDQPFNLRREDGTLVGGTVQGRFGGGWTFSERPQ